MADLRKFWWFVAAHRCTNCGGYMQMMAAACGDPYDSYHEHSCVICGRRERTGFGGVQVRNPGYPAHLLEGR